MYSVTRQHRKSHDYCAVEVSVGSLDYTNNNSLLRKYEGDCEEFDLAVDAANAAIAVLNLWQSDSPDEEIGIGYGSHVGWDIPFDTYEPDELLKWAENQDAMDARQSAHDARRSVHNRGR